MHGTTAALRAAGSRRLEGLTAANPEWRPWLAAVSAALDALHEPPATTLDVALAHDRTHDVGTDVGGHGATADDPASDAPLLDGATVRIDGGAAADWVARLFARAADAGHAPAGGVAAPHGAAACALIEAAACRDIARVRHIAGEWGASPEPVTALADLAAFPILQASRDRIAQLIPEPWQHGHCPCCGAWPALAELRGLERARRLRCGRCGGDWQTQWLACPFCRETEHRKLGSLSPEKAAETRRIDKCESCRCYVKTVTTLSAARPWEVLLADAETIDLDLAAIDRGYHRPPDGGRAVRITVQPRS